MRRPLVYGIEMPRTLQSVAALLALLVFAVASRAESSCWTDALEAARLDFSNGPITFDFEVGVGLWARPSLAEPVPYPARRFPGDPPSTLPDGEWAVELPPRGLGLPINLYEVSRVEFRFFGDVDEFLCCPDIRALSIFDTYYFPTTHYRLLDLDWDERAAFDGVARLDLDNLPAADDCGVHYSCAPWDRCGWFLIQAQKAGKPTWAAIDDVTIHPAPVPRPLSLGAFAVLSFLGLPRRHRRSRLRGGPPRR